MFNLAYLKAREMLQKNRLVLEKIVEELLEFEILTGKVMIVSVWDAVFSILSTCMSYKFF